MHHNMRGLSLSVRTCDAWSPPPSRSEPTRRVAAPLLGGCRIAAMVAACVLACLPEAALAQAAAYRINGATDIDGALCSQQGPTGDVVQQFWVLRRADVAGPTQVAIAGLPPNVTVSLSPASLTYPGWVTGQQVTATFTFNGGASIPDSIIEVRASDSAGNIATSSVTMHGTCPRHSQDFTIRGAFFSTHQSVTFPVAGALVDIYREVPYWSDQLVASAITDQQGNFDVKLWAGTVSTFYAKLRLNDVAGVYLREARTPEIKDYNSVARRDNTQPVIDLGATEITRDGGAGTPKTAVWQSGHWARKEFEQTFNAPAPIEDYEIVIENTISGMNWSLRSKTHWEEGTQVYKYSTGTPIAQNNPSFHRYFSQFENYDGLFHEFAHALRQTADGDDQHFFDDIVQFTYIREHDLCTVSNVGEAFNEGWAEFWAMDTGPLWQSNCPPADPTNMEQEGAVMNDIYVIARAVDACLPPTSSLEERYRQQRRNMFSALRRQVHSVHSDMDLRDKVQQLFPGCALPVVGGAGVAPDPRDRSPGGLLRAKATVPTARFLGGRATYYKTYAGGLSEELAILVRSTRATPQRRCADSKCEALLTQVLKPIFLKAQIAHAMLVARQLELLDAEAREQRDRPAVSTSAEQREALRLATNDTQTRMIVQSALAEGQRALQPFSSTDRTGAVKAQLSAMRMASRRLSLNTPNPLEFHTFFELPPAPDDDRATPYQK